ncbi:hypothetical protein GCM10023223_52150 [Stackebrandtia albiflava]
MEQPPPSEPPDGVLSPSLWPVQVRWWRRHTPKGQARICAVCGQSWPCHSWACWDGQIGEAVEAAKRHQAQTASLRVPSSRSDIPASVSSPRV